MGIIYTLSDPRNLEVRYIGFTSVSLIERYKVHIDRNHLKAVTHKNNWIKNLLNENLFPVIEEIEQVSILEWQFWEKYWISQFKQWGFNLTNMTDGGDGIQKGFKRGPQSIEHRTKLALIFKTNIKCKSNGGKSSVKEMICLCGKRGKTPSIHRHIKKCK